MPLVNYWINNEKLKRVLLEEKLSTEMAFLKSQINPHFLFNVLNSIYAKSLRYDAPDLSDSIAKLSHLMRYMVYETSSERVDLTKEVEHLKNFIKVYQLRIADEDDISISFDIKGDLSEIQVSPMLFIPLVENAMKHGIDPNERSEIKIELIIENEQLNFRVANTNHQRNLGLNDEHSGFGLANLRKRLGVLYEGKYQLEIDKEEDLFITHLYLNLKE